MNNIIKLENVTYSAGGFTILQDISARVDNGDIIFIAGRSGSGKSSLLKICAGLNYPTAGDVYIRGVSVRKATNSQMRDLHENNGFVFQDCALISNMTIYQNLELPLRYNNICPENEMKDRIDAMLSSLQLQDDRHNRPAQLSLGEKRLAAIGRTIINHPDLIYLDEPLVSLDSTHVKKIVDILLALKEKKTTMILISHRTRLIKDIGSHLWIIDNGRLSYSGRTADQETLDYAIQNKVIDPY
ncbi:MAG TPA: ATP-binding cassette domain-containing protein [Spirochaetota bacterium]|nr:ATP-binding cassette domain-containing protein [Spirochaetota bacterium]